MLRFLITLIRKKIEIRRNTRLSRAELEASKLKKFRKLVKYINKHSPYYSNIIRERKINVKSCVPEDFPIIDKTILLDNFDDIITDRNITKSMVMDFLGKSKNPNDLMLNKFQVLHTSGSSGEVGYFVFSQADWGRGVAQYPRARIKRQNWGRVKLAYFAATEGHFGGVSLVTTLRRRVIRRLVNLGVFEVNSPLETVLEELNSFKPEVLIGYTTAIKMLAEKQLAGALNIAPTIVETSGESLSVEDRAFLTDTFKCQVNNTYICSEHLFMGKTNPDGLTMTLYDDDLIFEFKDDHTLITNLFNFTLPLIRYRMADVIHPLADDNSHAPYLTTQSVVGRTEIIPEFLNENEQVDYISPFTIMDLYIPGVTRFQMCLIDRSHFQFKICAEPASGEQQKVEAIRATEKRLQEIFSQKRMSNVEFSVILLDDLPVDEENGKFSLIVNGSH